MQFPLFLRPMVRWINLLPVWRWSRVKVWGQRLRAPTFDRWLCLLLHQFGLMGRVDHAFFLKHLQPGMTVLDIGANQGLYTLMFSRRVGIAGHVFAFEPDDILYEALQGNVKQNQALNVQMFPCALGSRCEAMTLYRSLFNSGDNRLASNSHDEIPREAVQIRVETLDGLLAGQHVDMIKMDVQGWEMEVFRGMESLLDDPQNEEISVYFEYWPQGLVDAGSDRMEPLMFLSGKRFELSQVSRGKTEIITDLTGFAASVKANTYFNLYASRRRTPT